MEINTQALITRLKEPFPIVDHKERKLPGGGRWFYIPWQVIRDRLEELFPLDWSATYSDPVVVGDYTVIRCQLTILLAQGGITREGVGNDKAFPELNQQGKVKTIGTPPERARADAFKSAAEEFGIGAYLDDQAFVIRHMQTSGDGRAYKFAKENDWLDHGLPTSGGRPSDPPTSKGTATTETRPAGTVHPMPVGAQEVAFGIQDTSRRTGSPGGSVDVAATVMPASTHRRLAGSSDVLAQITAELKRVGWTDAQGREYLIQHYGKRSRQQLTDTELSDFLTYLRSCSGVPQDTSGTLF